METNKAKLERYNKDSEIYEYIIDYFIMNPSRVFENVKYLKGMNRLLEKDFKELSEKLTEILPKTIDEKVETELEKKDILNLRIKLNKIKEKRLVEGKPI